jgi:hypothetical protein
LDAALFEALRNEVQPSPGMVDVTAPADGPLLRRLERHADRVRLTLASAGLMPYFEGRIFTSADVPNPKPAPDLFLHAAASMNAAPAHVRRHRGHADRRPCRARPRRCACWATLAAPLRTRLTLRSAKAQPRCSTT